MFRHWLSTFKTKTVGAVLLFVFVSVFFFSLFHASVGMDMSGAVSDCMFMEHGEAVCSMSVTDHLQVWKDSFLATSPSLALLVLTISSLLLLFSIPPNLILSRKILQAQLFSFKKISLLLNFSPRPLQDLFSSGILHPKLF